MRRLALAVALVLVPGLAPAQTRDCSITGQNTFVRDTLRDIYFWYQQLPDVPPQSAASPEAYLEAVRYRPPDATFSYISSQASDTAFYSDSQFIGLGVTNKLEGDLYRVAQVFPDSPASAAGLERGDTWLTIGGHSVADLLGSGTLGDAFGPSDLGYALDVSWRSPDGTEKSAHLTKALVTIPTVSHVRVYEVNGQRVGYVHFRNFVQPSFAALDQAFAQLEELGVGQLILDLRYNGGGLVSVAQYLSGLIGGASTRSQTFTQFFHNDRNAFRNQILLFDQPLHALSVPKLVVITTRASASASELVINALRPFIPVVIVGDTTYGKPVGQYSYPFCDKVLHPVAFTLRNAAGFGDYFDGLPADCPAGDDLEHLFGDPQEASLAEALAVIETGACRAGARSQSIRRPDRLREGPWQRLVGAY
jgi:C-terminal processing protease CtpA/Prc